MRKMADKHVYLKNKTKYQQKVNFAQKNFLECVHYMYSNFSQIGHGYPSQQRLFRHMDSFSSSSLL